MKRNESKTNRKKNVFIEKFWCFWGHRSKVSKALIAVPRVAQECLRLRPKYSFATCELRLVRSSRQKRLSIERRSEIVPSLSGALFRVALTHIDTAGPTSRCCF